MRTLVWTAPETFVMEEREIPAILPGEVLIRVEAVGICGSEIEGFLGHNSLRVPPLVMGHEFCGVIEAVGELADASRIGQGQRVVVNPLISCGTCDRCRQGNENLCVKRSIVGIHRSGAFAEYAAVPATCVHPVPNSLNSYRASLAEPLACSLRATRRALEGTAYGNVLIFGAGTIGLLCGLVSRIMGARNVIVADTNAERLQTALACGIDYAVNPKGLPIQTSVKNIVSSGGVDVVIDAAGFQPTREAAMELINPGGTFMNIGLGIDETKLRINHLIRSEINLLGSFCYSRQDFADSVHMLCDGRITEKGWSEVRGLADGQAAFADLVAGSVSKAKIFMDPRL